MPAAGAAAAVLGSSDAQAHAAPRSTMTGQRVDAQEALARLRFGLFVHFGPASLTGRETGWGREAYRAGKTDETAPPYNDPTKLFDPVYDVAYKSFLPAKGWAEDLADVAVSAGMKYLVLTSKHHDGFPMFRARNYAQSFYPDLATTPLGKSKRDLVDEVAIACRRRGLELGLYYSGWDWTHPLIVAGKNDEYYEYMMSHLKQLMSQYGDISFLWYDGIAPTDLSVYRPPTFHSVPRNLQPGLLINNRGYALGWADPQPTLAGDYSTPEQRVGAFDVARAWESCITIGDQWSWRPNESIKSLATIVKTLISTATGDGNLLFNVGPKPSGEVDKPQRDRLAEVGRWMTSYGAAIYGTRGGPIRPSALAATTFKGATMNLFLFRRPARDANVLTVPNLNNAVVSATTPKGKAVPFTVRSDGRVDLDLTGLDIAAGPVELVHVRYRDPLSHEYLSTELIADPVRPGNLALNKPATQISTDYGGDAARAVDGNTDGNYFSNSVTHTTVDAKEAWWQVDLGASAPIGDVEIYNRTDGDFGSRLSDFWVIISDTPITAPDLATARTAPGATAQRHAGAAAALTTLNFAGTSARYVRIQLENQSGPLSLAEVSIYKP
ncbi:alpha-L-fucosidase [Kribbella sp. NPDC058245]|uniref:alpha-L-fucosidase n=1 Tax=Kribbella sp. NPDC058245 TaxID=3346399 RepID=UPI0036EE8A73